MPQLRYRQRQGDIRIPEVEVGGVSALRPTRYASSATASVISQASKMPNPPRWLEELDLSTWAAYRVANVERMRRG